MNVIPSVAEGSVPPRLGLLTEDGIGLKSSICHSEPGGEAVGADHSRRNPFIYYLRIILDINP